MITSKTTQELEKEFGRQLRDLRLRTNINQRTVADRAGVALNVIKNLESGKGATIRSAIKVLRTLGCADWLTTLAPEVSISPLQMLKSKHSRQRASREKGSLNV
jgi:transcriptional regulator with XRE-family HTH domain